MKKLLVKSLWFLLATTGVVLAARAPIWFKTSDVMQIPGTSIQDRDGNAITGGLGDVTAAAAFDVDNVLIRADGTGKGVQKSVIVVSDTGAVSAITTLAMTGALSGGTTIANTGNHTITAGNVVLDAAKFVSIKNANGDSYEHCAWPTQGQIIDADNYTLLTSDHCKLIDSTGTGTDVFTLLEADTASNIGITHFFIKSASTSGDMVITPQTGDKLNGVTNGTFELNDIETAQCTLTPYTSIDWYCVGTDVQ